MSDANLNRASCNSAVEEWGAARATFVGREREYLDAFLDGLPEGSTIVDAGCGTGRPMAEYILARGHHVIGVDQSEALLAKARERFPSETWIHAALETYPFETPCRGVICWDALFHIQRIHHQVILRRIADALGHGGRLMLTIGGSEHPPFTDTMFGREFFYDSYAPPAMIRLLEDLGFLVLIREFMDLPAPGRDKGRYAIVARRPLEGESGR